MKKEVQNIKRIKQLKAEISKLDKNYKDDRDKESMLKLSLEDQARTLNDKERELAQLINSI